MLKNTLPCKLSGKGFLRLTVTKSDCFFVLTFTLYSSSSSLIAACAVILQLMLSVSFDNKTGKGGSNSFFFLCRRKSPHVATLSPCWIISMPPCLPMGYSLLKTKMSALGASKYPFSQREKNFSCFSTGLLQPIKIVSVSRRVKANCFMNVVLYFW